MFPALTLVFCLLAGAVCESRVVVMVAMEEEAQFLRPMLTNTTDLNVIGLQGCSRGYVGGLTVDIIISGIGAVFASSATTKALMLEPAAPAAVLSCGCAGAHVEDQRMGDIVLGEDVVPLDPVVTARNGSRRLSGVRFTMTEPATLTWPADEELLGLSRIAATSVVERLSVDGRPPLVTIGTVGSGDAWRQSPSLINEIHNEYSTVCEEMEAHAVAQVCAQHDVPFLAIKDIANSELVPEGEQLMPEDTVTNVKTGLNAALVTYETLVLLAQKHAEPATPLRDEL